MARYEPPAGQRVFQWPIDPAVQSFAQWSGFGPRPSGPPGEFVDHFGLDVGAPAGTPIVAPAPGVVTRVIVAGSDDDDGCGNSVWTKHLEDDGWMIQSGIHHMRDAPLVSEGDAVGYDTRLGFVGETGNASGPHACWQTRIRGLDFNPRQVMRDYGRS